MPVVDMVNNDEIDAAGRFGLDEMCREGARTMLVSAPRPRSIKFTSDDCRTQDWMPPLHTRIVVTLVKEAMG